MSGYMYDSGVELFARGQLDWENTDARVLLVDSSYQPRQNEHATVADVRGFEVDASGTYRRGGIPLNGRSVENMTPGEILLKAGSVTVTGFTGQFRYVVVAAGDDLVGYADMGYQQVTDSSVDVAFRDGFCSFSVQRELGNS